MDDDLKNAKEKVRDILKALFKRFPEYDIQTSASKDDFIVDVSSLDVTVVEDMAGAIGNMASEILKFKDETSPEK